MDVTHILSAIDAEIERLQQARDAVAALEGASPIPGSRRTPRVAGATEGAPARRKRNLTPEGRKRIQEAMQRRWSERRRQLAAQEK
jgi:hypothetical protein